MFFFGLYHLKTRKFWMLHLKAYTFSFKIFFLLSFYDDLTELVVIQRKSHFLESSSHKNGTNNCKAFFSMILKLKLWTFTCLVECLARRKIFVWMWTTSRIKPIFVNSTYRTFFWVYIFIFVLHDILNKAVTTNMIY